MIGSVFNPSIQKVAEGDCCKSEIQSGKVLSQESREHRAMDRTQLLKSVFPADTDPWGRCSSSQRLNMVVRAFHPRTLEREARGPEA